MSTAIEIPKPDQPAKPAGAKANADRRKADLSAEIRLLTTERRQVLSELGELKTEHARLTADVERVKQLEASNTMRDEKLLPIHEKLMVSIDISNLRLSSSAAGRRASQIRVTDRGEEQQGGSLLKRFRNISVIAYEFRCGAPILTKTALIWMGSTESI